MEYWHYMLCGMRTWETAFTQGVTISHHEGFYFFSFWNPSTKPPRSMIHVVDPLNWLCILSLISLWTQPKQFSRKCGLGGPVPHKYCPEHWEPFHTWLGSGSARIRIQAELSHKCENPKAKIEDQLRGSDRIRAEPCSHCWLGPGSAQIFLS